MSLLSVPIFYASKSPPPPLPLLTKQTEIRIPAAIVLAQEPIDPKQLDYVAPRPRLLLVKSRAQSRVTFDLKPLSQAPESTLGNLGYRSESAAPPEPREFVSEPPDAPLIENSPGSEPEAQSLIEKPRGSYGRPGAGGYNIDQAVTKHNISARDFEEIKEYVVELVGLRLKTDLCYMKQNTAAINSIKEDVAERFPVMDRFLDHWPITDLIQACLKASSRKARIESEQQPVETAKPVRNVGSNRKKATKRYSPM